MGTEKGYIIKFRGKITLKLGMRHIPDFKYSAISSNLTTYRKKGSQKYTENIIYVKGICTKSVYFCVSTYIHANTLKRV